MPRLEGFKSQGSAFVSHSLLLVLRFLEVSEVLQCLVLERIHACTLSIVFLFFGGEFRGDFGECLAYVAT